MGLKSGKRCVAITQREERCRRSAPKWPLCSEHWRQVRMLMEAGARAAESLGASTEEDVLRGNVWSLHIDQDAYVREDPELSRALGWACVLADHYPALHRAARGPHHPWDRVAPLLNDREQEEVEARIKKGLRQGSARRGHPLRLEASTQLALVKYRDEAGRQLLTLGVVSSEGEVPRLRWIKRVEDSPNLPKGTLLLESFTDAQSAEIVKRYTSIGDVFQAIAENLSSGGYAIASPEAVFWRSRIGNLQQSWTEYYEPQVGISIDHARAVRRGAARSFTECLDLTFPLVEFHGRSLPLPNMRAIHGELKKLLEAIRSDGAIIRRQVAEKRAEAIRIKFAPLLHPSVPDLAHVAAEILVPRTTPSSVATRMLATWCGVHESTIRKRLSR